MLRARLHCVALTCIHKTQTGDRKGGGDEDAQSGDRPATASPPMPCPDHIDRWWLADAALYDLVKLVEDVRHEPLLSTALGALL